MIKSRARNFVSFFRQSSQRNRQKILYVNENRGVDQTDKSAQKTSRRHSLDMEKYLTQGDEVFHSSKYRKFLFSSSDEDSVDDHYNFKTADNNEKLLVIDSRNSKETHTNIDSDDECGEDQVYAIDAFTGEWKAYRQQPNFPGENFKEISKHKRTDSSTWKNMGRKALRTSLNISNKMHGRRTRTVKTKYDLEDGENVKLLNDYDTDDSNEDESLSLCLVDSSTDTSTNIGHG